MRAPSVPSTALSWAAVALVAVVITVLTVPSLPDRTVVTTCALAVLAGVAIGAGRARLRAASAVLARLSRVAPATESVRWVTVTEESRTVRFGLRRLCARGITVRSGVGVCLLDQRWLPYAGAGDDSRLAGLLRRTAGVPPSDPLRLPLSASIGERGVLRHQHVEADRGDEPERADRHDASGEAHR